MISYTHFIHVSIIISNTDTNSTLAGDNKINNNRNIILNLGNISHIITIPKNCNHKRLGLFYLEDTEYTVPATAVIL